MAIQTAVRIVQYDQKNPPACIEVAQVPKPTPGAGEVLVRLTLRPINPADIFSLIGVYPGFQPKELPAIPGLEGVGVVDENGAGASKYAPGTRVVAAPFTGVPSGNGTWQQYVVAKESDLIAVPEGISDEVAAQFWINPVTVYGMLEVLNVPKGEWLLQTAAGSVLGRQMIQLAKSRGIKTINLVRRRELEAELKALGADEVVVSTEGDWVETVKQLTGGRGAWAGIDAVSGDTLGKVMSATRANGTVLAYGAMDGIGIKASVVDPLFRGVTLAGFWLVPWAESLPPKEREQMFLTVMQLLQDGVMTPYTGTRYPLEKAAEAVAHATAAARGGKVLLEG